jgi:hypothetical protein
VHIDAFYDRGDLVAITVRTVLNNMLFGVPAFSGRFAADSALLARR